MLWFIIGCILAVIGIGWFVFAPGKTTKTVEKVVRRGGISQLQEEDVEFRSTKPAGFLILLVAAMFVAISCVAIVGTKNTGVKTIFNKPTGETIGAGLEIKLPWVAVTDIDSTIQPEEYTGDNAIKVKIADGGDAEIWISYRWRINPENADKVFQDYRNSELEINDAVRKAIVSTNIKAAINEVLGGYDPLAGVADLTADATPEELANIEINVVPDYQQLNADIQKNVDQKISDNGDLVEIQSVTVSRVVLPEGTQKRINAYNTAVQDTRIALQEVATRAAQAEGNEELADSLQDPNVLVSKCFDLLAEGAFDPPAGFSCWNAANSVVIPGTK